MQRLRKVNVGVSLVQCNRAVIRTSTDRDRVPIAMLLVLEPRHLGLSSCFDGGEEGRYDEWRFQLVSYLTAIHLHLADVTVDVALRTHHTERTTCHQLMEKRERSPADVPDHREMHQEQAACRRRRWTVEMYTRRQGGLTQSAGILAEAGRRQC